MKVRKKTTDSQRERARERWREREGRREGRLEGRGSEGDGEIGREWNGRERVRMRARETQR